MVPQTPVRPCPRLIKFTHGQHIWWVLLNGILTQQQEACCLVDGGEAQHGTGCTEGKGEHKCFVWCMAGLFSPPHHRVNTNQLPVWRTWTRAQGSFQHSHALCSAVYSLARHPAARLGSDSPCCAGESQSCHSGWCIWVPFADDRQVLDIVLCLLQCTRHCVPWLSSELPTLQELRSCVELGARNKIRSLPLLGSQTQTKTFI